MDRDEYDRHRSALEKIYRSDIELVRAAHEARVRSLEALWMAQVPGPAPVAAPKISPAAPAPAASPRPRNPDLRTAIEEAFPDLPETFQKKDIIAAIGWTPSRGSLYRVLLDLAIEGRLEVTASGGRIPTQYRKTG